MDELEEELELPEDELPEDEPLDEVLDDEDPLVVDELALLDDPDPEPEELRESVR